MARRAVLALSIALAAPAAARDPAADAGWVPFELTPANQIRFTLRLDGMPQTALLDTGVSHSALSRRVAETRGLALRAGGLADTIGGAVPYRWTTVPRLSFGGVDWRTQRLAVVDLPPAASGRSAVDLLAGRDLLAGYALDIDFPARRFRLLPSGRLPFAGTILPLAIGGSRPAYLSTLDIAGRRIDRMAIDTGDGGGVTLSEAAWRRVGAAPPTARPTRVSYGIGGVSVAAMVTVPRIAIGDVVARDVPVAIEAAGGFAETIGVSGRIGSGFFSRYRVLLDPGAGRLVLMPAADRALALDPTPRPAG